MNFSTVVPIKISQKNILKLDGLVLFVVCY